MVQVVRVLGDLCGDSDMTNRLAKSKAAAITAGSEAGSASVVTATVPTAAWSVQVSVPAPGLLRAPVGAMVRNVLCGGCYEAA